MGLPWSSFVFSKTELCFKIKIFSELIAMPQTQSLSISQLEQGKDFKSIYYGTKLV